MRIIATLVLAVHAFAHLVGFVVPWRLSTQVPYKTTIFGGVLDVGDTGIEIVGILWLLTALAFAGAAVGAGLRASWWPPFTLAVAGVSLVMCVVGWPEARLGALINLGIIVILFVGTKAGWSFIQR